MSKHINFADETNAHHVKFNIEEEEFKHHHERLEILKIDDKSYNVNLGYLKVDHYYRVAFDLDDQTNPDELVYLKHKSSKNLTLKEMKSSKNGTTSFVFIFFAFKEKSERENAFFGISGEGSDNACVQICFEAKVLGEHQGTPALRSGVTLLHNNNHNTENNAHFNFN